MTAEDNNTGYRFGFNGKEQDFSYSLLDGVTYDFDARIFDSRIGRWLSVDPEFKEYSGLSPFSAFGLNPLVMVDPGGETLRVAGNMDLAKRDIYSIIPKSYIPVLDVANDGSVSINIEKYQTLYKEGKIPNGNDAGWEIVSRLVLADEKYEYRVADKVNVDFLATPQNSKGEHKVLSAGQEVNLYDRNQVLVASTNGVATFVETENLRHI